MNSSSYITNYKESAIKNGIMVKIKLKGRINMDCNILEINLNDMFLHHRVIIINTKNEKIFGMVMSNQYIYFEKINTYCESGSIIYILTDKYSQSIITDFTNNFISILKDAINFVRTIDISAIDVTMVFDMDYNDTVGSKLLSEGFEDLFTISLSESLEIDSKRIQITSIEKGSVIVNFKIIETTKANQLRSIRVAEEFKYLLSNKTDENKLKTNPIFKNIIGLKINIIKQNNIPYNDKYGFLGDYYIHLYESVFKSDNMNDVLFDDIELSIPTNVSNVK